LRDRKISTTRNTAPPVCDS